MRLGNFSVSLAVKDIAKSREFYEELGFRVILGDQQELAHPAERRIHHRAFPGDVQQEHADVQPGLGPVRQRAAGLRRRPGDTAGLKESGFTLAAEADESSRDPRA